MAQILSWKFDVKYMTRGLVIDKRRGNILKVSFVIKPEFSDEWEDCSLFAQASEQWRTLVRLFLAFDVRLSFMR